MSEWPGIELTPLLPDGVDPVDRVVREAQWAAHGGRCTFVSELGVRCVFIDTEHQWHLTLELRES